MKDRPLRPISVVKPRPHARGAGAQQAATPRSSSSRGLALLRRRPAGLAPTGPGARRNACSGTKGQLSPGPVPERAPGRHPAGGAGADVIALKEEVEKLTAPPSGFGSFVSINEDGTINITSSGRKLRVNVHPDIDPQSGSSTAKELMLNEARNVVEACAFEVQGEVVQLKEMLGVDQALVIGNADEERVVQIGEALRNRTLRASDSLLLDVRSRFVLGHLPKPEVEELILEEVNILLQDRRPRRPDREADPRRRRAAIPARRPVREHQLKPPKGILSTGPGLRQDPDRQGGGQLAGQEGGRGHPASRRGAATSSTSRAPSCSTSTWGRPSARSG